MNFISLKFIFFLIVFLTTYYIIPRKFRYVLILLGSYYFYSVVDIKFLLYLMYSTVVTYIGGIVLSKHKEKWWLCLFIVLNVGMLIVAKYGNLFPICGGIVLPIGMSFYIFQSTTYITDIYRDNVEREKNFFLYAAFVSFFPTLLSGPIQKSRELLPQLRYSSMFDEDQMKKGIILFIWGCFEKLLVSNRLNLVISAVYDDNMEYSAPYYLLAMFLFSIYIYADFSAYSDMARGVAKMLGINVGKNFETPYLSLSLSEFWNRWHKSLNSWFLENIYIPMGGNRKGLIRKYINIMIVFIISGAWHGAFIHFILWGGINGLLVVFEDVLKPLKHKMYKLLKISEDLESVVFLKRVKVFFVISLTWLFFNNGVSTAFKVLQTLVNGHFIDYFDENLLLISGSAASMLVTTACAFIFVSVQCRRARESYYYDVFDRQPVLLQGGLMALLIVTCVFAATASFATVNTEFLYFGF